MARGGVILDKQGLDELYSETDYWQVNVGEQTIHAKRMAGRFRRLKWLAASVWLLFFLGPYLRWQGQQAVLFDIPARQFHLFGITLLPQDIWLLTMVLLFFALLLAAVTSVAGRVYCGFFCFQTVWTDVFTWIEERIEGPPQRRQRLDQAPWDSRKLFLKSAKHLVYLLIGLLTGISFTLWFGDARELWSGFVHFDAPLFAWGTVATFTFFTYLFAGHMREQVCFWLCPYARIQGAMVDRHTVLPTYDFSRGEPRGKLKQQQAAGLGDCIDCAQCVAVCPTGVDIRRGQQEGCITCALCIDACDAIMDKVGRAHGLIRYASLDEVEGGAPRPLLRRPRVMVYLGIVIASVSILLYGLASRQTLELKVLHERQPLFVVRSDGSVQNRYELKVVNKAESMLRVRVRVSGHAALTTEPVLDELSLPAGKVTAQTLFVRVPARDLSVERMPLFIRIEDLHSATVVEYESMFFAPVRSE